MKAPGLDHPITVTPFPRRVRVVHHGQTVADTSRAMELREASCPPVFYIPRDDADMALLEPTDHQTHCPHKGQASYFSIVTDGAAAKNAVWSYQEPLPAVAGIKDHLAFYPDRIDRIEVSD